jgi:endoglucanase
LKTSLNVLRRLAVALAFGAAGANAEETPTPMPDSPPTLQQDWEVYRPRFITEGGRLFDDSAGYISHSEGQGYAMLLAVYCGDRETFDKLWGWTVTNLEVRSDGLFAWRWRPGDEPHVKDPNNATDGDLLIGWALAEAGRRWDAKIYDPSARKIAHAIAANAMFPSPFGPLLSPGIVGFSAKDRPDGPVVNLSYWVFPAFNALQRVAPDVDWAALRKSGLALLAAAKFGPRKLPSDWIALKDGPHPADGFPARFGNDAVRTPLYLAWGMPKEHDALAALMEAWTGPDDGQPDVVDLTTGEAVETLPELGYRAVAAFGRCIARGAPFPVALRTLDVRRYYPATLQFLALIALEQSGMKCQ